MLVPLVTTTVFRLLFFIARIALAGIVASSTGQPSKAPVPMLVTLSGITMETKALQPEKACLPILVTPSGIVTDVKPLQS